MQDKPIIRTAIPKRRYQVGDHAATLLGEIESGDMRSFRYILAFVALGQREPSLYVCSESSPPREADLGRYRLRLVNETMSEVMDSDDRWGDLETFADQALKLGAQALGLQREAVIRLM
jgi:hypothetical protein